MFDIFATILSAGVVISVVTLVVHEPMLLAAGISTILGLMFLLLPMFVAMVPALGYLLIFIGLVGLAYGMASTRSWLNSIQARRDAAMARRRAQYAGAPTKTPGKNEVDSERRRTLEDEDFTDRRGAGLRDEDVESPAANFDEEPVTKGRTTGLAGKAGKSALARLGRGLGRERPVERRPEPEEDVVVPKGGKPWRNPFGNDPEAESKPAAPAEPEREQEPERETAAEPVVKSAATSTLPPPLLPPPLPAPEPVAVAAASAAAAAIVRPPRPAKPLSPGAARMLRIKAESRRPAQATKRRPVETAPLAPASPSPAPVPVAVAEPLQPVAPPVTVVVAVAQPAADAPDRDQHRWDVQEQDTRRARRERDLIELDLLDMAQDRGETKLEREPKANGRNAMPAKDAKTFVARLARRP